MGIWEKCCPNFFFFQIRDILSREVKHYDINIFVLNQMALVTILTLAIFTVQCSVDPDWLIPRNFFDI